MALQYTVSHNIYENRVKASIMITTEAFTENNNDENGSLIERLWKDNYMHKDSQGKTLLPQVLQCKSANECLGQIIGSFQHV